MGLKGRLKRAERLSGVDMILVPQPDGSVKRFHPDALLDALVSSYDRGRAHLEGEPLPEPHPLLQALYSASEETVNELSEAHGMGMVGFMAGEEQIVRGDVERPGPEVTWNEGEYE